VHFRDVDRPQSCSITSVRHLKADEATPYVRTPKVPKPEVKHEG
jgi:hypothetical protein